MSLHSQLAFLALWCAHPLLQGIVAVVLWRRRLHKQFPVFFAYILAQTAIFAATFPLWVKAFIYRQPDNYAWFFWLYWAGAALNAVLGFKVIHEIFLDVFRPYHTLKDLGTVLFRWAGVVMLLVSVVVAFSSSSEQDLLVHAVTTLQRSVRLVQVGLIFFLLVFSRFLGVSRRQFSFGVALGFGMFACAELILLALSSGGLLHKPNVGLANMLAYNLAILVWLGYSLVRKAVPEAGVNHLRTQRWEEGLADLQHPVPPDSLIPMFEGMVERAFSRNSDLGPLSEKQSISSSSSLSNSSAKAVGAGSKGRG